MSASIKENSTAVKVNKTSQTKKDRTVKNSNNNNLTNGDSRPVSRNAPITQYFPIRRSERKPKTTLIQEKKKEMESKILGEVEEGLRVCFFIYLILYLLEFCITKFLSFSNYNLNDVTINGEKLQVNIPTT